MIKINLLPAKAVRKDVKNREFVVIAVAALAVVLAAIFFVAQTQSATLRDREKRISKLRAEIAALQKKVKEVEEFKKKQEALRRKIGIIEELRKKKTGPVRVLDDLSVNIPDDVWLSTFKETGGRVALQGQGIDDEGISEFLKALQRNPDSPKLWLRLGRSFVARQNTSGTGITQDVSALFRLFARMLSKLDLADQAVAVSEAAMQLDPKNADLTETLSKVLKRRERRITAQKADDQAAEQGDIEAGPQRLAAAISNKVKKAKLSQSVAPALAADDGDIAFKTYCRQNTETALETVMRATPRTKNWLR